MTREDEHGCKLVMVLKEAVTAYFKVLFTYYLSAIKNGYILNTSLICYHINFGGIKD